MLGVGEHIDGLEEGDAVAALLQQGKVTRLCFGAAADVDDAAGRQPDGGGEKLRRAAAAGRVHQEDIEGEVLFGGGEQPAGGIGGDKADIFDPVFLSVANGVPHGGGVLLHADDLARPRRGDHADGADAAVGVQHPFPAGEGSRRDGAAVQHLGLGGVDLVKGAGRDAKAHAAQGIADKARAVQDLLPLAQQHTGAAVIHILYDGGDLGVLLQESLNEILAGGEYRCGGDQHHHDLAGMHTAPHQYMTQKAGAGVLIVGGKAEGGQQPADGGDDGGGDFVLIEAALDIDDAVAALLVGAGNDGAAGAIPAEGGFHLIAVVAGIFGTQYGLYPAETGKVLLGDRLLIGKLLGVGEVQELAAAAAFIIGTVEFFHGGSPGSKDREYKGGDGGRAAPEKWAFRGQGGRPRRGRPTRRGAPQHARRCLRFAEIQRGKGRGINAPP